MKTTTKNHRRPPTGPAKPQSRPSPKTKSSRNQTRTRTMSRTLIRQSPTETISLDSTSEGGSAEANGPVPGPSSGSDIVDLTSDQAAVVDLTNDTVLVLDEDQTQSYIVSSDEEEPTPTRTKTRSEPRTRANRSGVHIRCPICLDSYFEIVDSGRLLVSTRCGHVFCSVCSRDALRQTQTCPVCRTRLKRGQTHPLYM